jgi:hypothetical protein
MHQGGRGGGHFLARSSMKASEVISHLKTLIHHHGDVEVKDVTPQTIEYHDGNYILDKPTFRGKIFLDNNISGE